MLSQSRLQRAIGVIYRPETERWSHNYQANVTEQFRRHDHLDETRALEPLDRNAGWECGELADTFPTSL